MFQSAYRAHHSTETALLRILNDLLLAVDCDEVALVVLLDLSAAFDTIDHEILIARLNSFGISSTALNWFASYLTERSQQVKIGESSSNDISLTCGVPQGSILGPLLYSIYTQPLSKCIDQHGIPHHLFADDTMIYATSKPAHFVEIKSIVQSCCSDIKEWMSVNHLKLNEDKTEVILIGREKSRQQIGDTQINIAGANIAFATSVRYLGVMLDQSLSLDPQIGKIISSGYMHLHRIWSIRDCPTERTAAALVVTLVLSHLDYCNSLLTVTTNSQ